MTDVEFIEKCDARCYDTEAMLIDESNGNFSQEEAECYLHTNIVTASIINGQFKQAKEQCIRYGLHYNSMRRAAGLESARGESL